MGLKKLASRPLVTKDLKDAATNNMLNTIPEQPSPMLRHHILLYRRGFFMATHMKHGYARLRGSAIAPMNAPRLAKNGKANAIQYVNPPNKILIPDRSHPGHGLFFVLV